MIRCRCRDYAKAFDDCRDQLSGQCSIARKRRQVDEMRRTIE